MTIEDALKVFLRARLGIDRVYSHKAPQSPVEPYVVFYEISPTPRHTHAGPFPTLEQRYQFSVYGKSQSATADLRNQVRQHLDGYRGLMGDVYVSGAHWAGGTYGYNDATGMHHFSADMQIRYREQ